MELSYPNPIKIPEEILKFIHRNNSISNTLKKHLMLILISKNSSINDENGRLARFVQNSILSTPEFHHKYFP
jgi:hypothetical protein